MKQWRKHLKDIRLEQILKVLVNDFVTKRLKAGRSPRTCNLDVVILRNVIKRAINDGLLPANPIAGLKPLKVTTRKRSLASAAEIDKVIEAAFQTRTNEKGESVPVTQNARQFADYIRFLQFTGAREKEALRVKWADVDSEGGHVTIGADGDTKNHKGRTVEFNPKLASLLKEMSRRRAPDSEWLFPSPQRGEKDIRARSFRESLNLTRSAAGLPKFGFHDCRHHFISMAVMSGVDYMTIASWVGHQDGGVLIGKVYGPQANEHKKAMAVKLNFGPTVLERTGSPVPRLMKKKPTAFELAQLAAKAAPPNARPKDVVRRAWLFWVEAERELAEHERRSEYLRRLFWTPDGKNIPIFTGTPAVLEARIKECPGDYQEVSRAMWNQEFSTLVVEKELFRDRTLSQEARHKLFLGLAKAYTR